MSQLARPAETDPNTPLTSDEFGEVLQEVESIETTDANGHPQACCPACRRILETAGIMDAAVNG